MRIRIHRQAGNVMLATLVLTMIVGFALGSYLKLVGNQNESVMRSLRWNSAIALIEAGIEDAMTHIYRNKMDHLSADGWTASSSVVLGGVALPGTQHLKQRQMEDGYYVVAVSETTPPVIVSEGHVKVPLKESYVVRTVRCTTRQDGMFAKGMVAKGKIDFNGQNVASDSFDSADPNYSTNGQWSATMPAKDNGDVASNSGIVGLFNMGNANIYGRASTGPGGTITLGPNGGVGTHVWQASHKGIQEGYSSDDMNVQFPPVQDPFSSGYFSPGGNPLTLNITGNYLLSDLTKSLVVKSNVQAVLKVTGSINLTGQDKITIEKGASLKLYMAGNSASIGGNGVVNLTGNSTNFAYYGLPSNKSLTFAGNGTFVGTIYAPDADFNLKGGGSGAQDFVGASVTSTVTMNGHFKFHYDEDLGRRGPSRGFIITSWNEI